MSIISSENLKVSGRSAKKGLHATTGTQKNPADNARAAGVFNYLTPRQPMHHQGESSPLKNTTTNASNPASHFRANQKPTIQASSFVSRIQTPKPTSPLRTPALVLQILVRGPWNSFPLPAALAYCLVKRILFLGLRDRSSFWLGAWASSEGAKIAGGFQLPSVCIRASEWECGWARLGCGTWMVVDLVVGGVSVERALSGRAFGVLSILGVGFVGRPRAGTRRYVLVFFQLGNVLAWDLHRNSVVSLERRMQG
ncbi:hypothetical protein BDV95DRAFT_126760 [Massariosphaeria phaeospora]|uniref:Uncharacterized protein n=1 Tax=Massariosphaeria phaeospora TaxID=100035 RepID=A0A7C8I6C4_9PLEO|nr:hypothetical protein BDV95DRAFT_126760 [Massariosphaeria phaeospora]